MVLSAPAKVNLGLRVGRKRPDGFHEIVTIIAPVEFADTVTIQRAEAGAIAEMTVDILFSVPAGNQPVVFSLERGDIGFSQLEFSRPVGEQWVVIQDVRWGEITGDGTNAHKIELTVEQLVSQLPSPTQDSGEGTVSLLPQGTEGYPWWNDTVFYEIFVRSFYDSNGDGIGDLNGITEKLDYLNDGDPQTTADLGITGIWLMPIYPSPSYHGYSVTDFYAVNPQYGTLADLQNLLAAAHARGIRVILDITLNHTSSQHPWFLSACDPTSPYHDWYIWSDVDPGYLGYWGEQVWFPCNDLYFYSIFSANFADLNYNNPAVLAEMQNVVRFWLEDVGVDGFRLDAAKHLIEDGSIQANSDSTHAWWETFRPIYKQINPQAMTVAEIWDEPAINAEYIQGDEVDLAFDFYLAAYFISAINDGNADIVNDQIELGYSLVPAHQFATFLTNHDMNRFLWAARGDKRKLRLAALCQFTLSGSPVIYYGTEVGLSQVRDVRQGNFGLPEESRLPMLWGSAQDQNLLVDYQRLSELRRELPALSEAGLQVITADRASLVYQRGQGKDAVCVVINLSEKTHPISLPGHYNQVRLAMGMYDVSNQRSGETLINLEGMAGLVLVQT